MATVKLDPAKGVQIPNMTTTERDAVSSPETGALVWNTTTSAVNQYNGSAWKEMLRSDGSAASLTAIPAANITGTLPAISGANLTGLSSFDPDGAVTINDSGADVDFRVEGSGAANALFVQGSDGNVGIGTNSPTVVDAAATGLHIHGDSNATNRAQLHLTSATTGASGTNGMYILYDGVTPQIQIRENQPLVFWLNGSERMRVLASGGLTFNGDTAAANALDDYEEGTWTVAVSCSTSGSYVMDTGNNVAAYTKIGRVVHIQGGIGIDGESSPNGNIRMTLPFTPFSGSKDTDYSMGNLTIGSHGGNFPSNINLFIVGNGDPYGYLWGVNDNGIGFYVDHSDVDTKFGFQFSCTYITSA